MLTFCLFYGLNVRYSDYFCPALMKINLRIIVKNLLALLFLYIALHHLDWMEELQQEIRREVNIHLLKNNFSGYETAVFSEHELRNANWEHSREFYLKEHLYDVYRISHRNGTKYFHCIKDKKETAVKKYLGYFKLNKASFEKKTDAVAKLYQPLSMLPKGNWYKFQVQKNKKQSFFFRKNYYCNYFSVQSVPPELKGDV